MAQVALDFLQTNIAFFMCSSFLVTFLMKTSNSAGTKKPSNYHKSAAVTESFSTCLINPSLHLSKKSRPKINFLLLFIMIEPLVFDESWDSVQERFLFLDVLDCKPLVFILQYSISNKAKILFLFLWPLKPSSPDSKIPLAIITRLYKVS